MRQQPSIADLPDAQSGAAPNVGDAVANFARFGFLGLIWLDRALAVTATFGPLLNFVTVSRPVTESIPAIIGLEADILALRRTPDRVIELPSISVAQADGAGDRLNFAFSWDQREDRPLIIVSRSNAPTELEIELSRQTRARLMAEAKAMQTSKELARANADLEAFAAIVSHDLKGPLRHIRYLADAATFDAASSECEAVGVRLQQLSRMSERLSRMLTTLFEYSSLGQKEEAIELVDTADLLRSIVETQWAPHFTITVEGDWPAFKTLRAPLDSVLRNLISNAVNHHHRPSGRIAITGKDSDDRFIITVCDDGPGISKQDQQTIFLPFRRLDEGANPDSTGMGLAMVKRLLEIIGGSISVSSDPEIRAGAAFVVSWPKSVAI
jgi:signal transduction histidine kinase